jgi:beta-lactamase regulating signal transducer with metallopeptidase domain
MFSEASSLWRNAEIWAFRVWVVGALVVLGVQVFAVLRFRAVALRGAEPAPEWLTRSTAEVAARIDVTPPPILVVPRLSTPVLWCLGRTTLLIPRPLVDRLQPAQWAAILGHELAHLRRRDTWVGRWLLVLGLVWWWNPLFQYARRRIEAEAELACDAWVTSVFPSARRLYAEALLDVCDAIARKSTPAPALGVLGGSRRFFERRLHMILGRPVSHRLSRKWLLLVAFITLAAVPSWSRGQQDSAKPADSSADTLATPSDASAAERLLFAADAARAQDLANTVADGQHTHETKAADAALAEALLAKARALKASADKEDAAAQDAKKQAEQLERARQKIEALSGTFKEKKLADDLLFAAKARVGDSNRQELLDQIRSANADIEKAQRRLADATKRLAELDGAAPESLQKLLKENPAALKMLADKEAKLLQEKKFAEAEHLQKYYRALKQGQKPATNSKSNTDLEQRMERLERQMEKVIRALEKAQEPKPETAPQAF